MNHCTCRCCRSRAVTSLRPCSRRRARARRARRCCARRADDDAELHLPVHLLRGAAMPRHIVERAVDGGRRLGEEHRHLGQLGLAACAPPRSPGVRRVVAARRRRRSSAAARIGACQRTSASACRGAALAPATVCRSVLPGVRARVDRATAATPGPAQAASRRSGPPDRRSRRGRTAPSRDHGVGRQRKRRITHGKPGAGMDLVGRRSAGVYSALALSEPGRPAVAGSGRGIHPGMTGQD